MNNYPKYYSVCDESIYIILKSFIENTDISIKDLHPCLTKLSNCETRKHVVKNGYINTHNAIETMTKDVFWINPQITDKGLKFLDDHNHFIDIYEFRNNNSKSEQ